MEKKRISIREIAKLSGVSIATVSRIINNNGRFSHETKKRVLSVIKENNYETNSMAKALRMNRSNTVGIIVPNLSNAFFSSLVESLESELFKQGLSTIICDAGRNSSKEENYLNILEAKLIDGLIVISGQKEFDAHALTRSIPVVCIDRKPTDSNVMFVSSDHYAGAVLATEELISKGTVPLLFKSDYNAPSISDRVQGFVDTINKHGLGKPNTITIELSKQPNNDTIRLLIRTQLRNILAKINLPIGIFAVSDSLAADIMIAARELSLSIPRDIRIVGFDDSPLAEYCYPSLSTIRQDVVQISTKSTNFLVSKINHEEGAFNNPEIVGVSFVKRETT